MKFLSYRSQAYPNGAVGLLSGDESEVVPLRFPNGQLVGNLFDLIENWEEVSAHLLPGAPKEKVAAVTVQAPLVGRDILAVGKNYKEHAKEFQQSGYDSSDKNEQPDFPVIFSKRASSIVPSGTAIYPHPSVTSSLDYEGELAIIIGKPGIGIKKENAWDHVWGATIVNDVTARERQRDHKQFLIGKSLDTFCPMGPFAVPKSMLDWSSMMLETKVNGTVVQSQNTSELIFDIPTLIETCSLGITLQPGDVIATGTPAGVGIGKKPPVFLKSGDSIEVSITSLGTLKNTVSSSDREAPKCEAVRRALPKPKLLADQNLQILPSGRQLHIEYEGVVEQNGAPNGATHIKPPVVFIHGLGGRSSNYDAILYASKLAETHFVIKVDLEGHGLSPLQQASLTVDDFADSISEVLDYAKVHHVTVVGHSMGGIIATTFAAKYPDKAAKLFLIGPVKSFGEPGIKALTARSETVSKGGMAAISDAVTNAGISELSHSGRPLAKAAVRASLLSTPADGYAQACLALTTARDPDYSKITAPTLILAGSEDKTAPAATIDFLSKQIRGAEVQRIENVGHWHLIEDVEAVAKALKSFA